MSSSIMVGVTEGRIKSILADLDLALEEAPVTDDNLFEARLAMARARDALYYHRIRTGSPESDDNPLGE